MVCHAFHALNLQWCHILILLPADSKITQLQKLWIVPTHYTVVLFRSQHYYRPGLIILTIESKILW